MRSLLTAERVALNFLMRLSGIATHTRSCVSQAGSLRVVDTRKTTPLHRALEKHAVLMGGGHNHRFALYDAVLIKENHIMASGGVQAAVERAKAAVQGRFGVQVEVETPEQLEAAIGAGADPALLDILDALGILVWDETRDFTLAQVRDMVDLVKRDRNHPSIILWSIGNEGELQDPTGEIGPAMRRAVRATVAARVAARHRQQGRRPRRRRTPPPHRNRAAPIIPTYSR